MKNLILTAFLLLSVKLSHAQPKSENLSAIDPRLINGFTMTEVKLTSAMYKGQPINGESISDTKMLIGLRKLQALQVSGSKSKYQFQVIPYFSFKSWLADTVKSNPEILAHVLKHEQNHYDIHLIMAHELKKQLSATLFDSRNYAEGILEIRDRLSLTENKIRQLYQIETNYGRNAEAQQQWDVMIAKALQTKNWGMLSDYVKGKM
jgi:hypothetical protein